MKRIRSLLGAVPALLLALVLTACGGGSDPGGTGGTAADAPAGTSADVPGDADDPDADDADGPVVDGELLVFAAASLTDAFEEIADALSEAHPDLAVTYNFAGSQALAAQLVEGAPADVFASASGAQMGVAEDAELVDAPSPFVSNRLAIVVEAGNPLGITGLEDLARDDIVLVLAGEEVPAGQYAAEALDAAGVEVSPASLEVDVRATLSKVQLGEADAAIVYESDVVTAGDSVEAVGIPDDQNVVASYPVAVLSEAPNPAAAAAFVAFLGSDEGREILERYGFRAP